MSEINKPYPKKKSLYLSGPELEALVDMMRRHEFPTLSFTLRWFMRKVLPEHGEI